jgi:hypothetical protein
VSRSLRRSQARGIPPPTAVAALHVAFPDDTTCRGCDFRPPAPNEAASELRALASIWEVALVGGDEDLIDEAARMRDEIHAVAKRIGRLLDAPGSRISPVRIEIPTASARGATAQLVIALLGNAAEGLGQLVESLGADDWRIEGSVGTGRVSVYELACVPLHTTHRELAAHKRRAEDELMVLEPRRWASSKAAGSWLHEEEAAHRAPGLHHRRIS